MQYDIAHAVSNVTRGHPKWIHQIITSNHTDEAMLQWHGQDQGHLQSQPAVTGVSPMALLLWLCVSGIPFADHMVA